LYFHGALGLSGGPLPSDVAGSSAVVPANAIALALST
jgi:hypothetical protein